MFFGLLLVLWGSLWAPLGAPLGAPGAPLGAPGAPLGVQGRKSHENHGSFPMVLEPLLEHFFVKDAFFNIKVHGKSVLLAGCCFYREFCGILIDF